MAIDKHTVESLSHIASIKLGSSHQYYIFFADLCGSADFKTYCKSKSVPDGAWIERQLIYLHRIINTVGRYKGTIVKTIGDEVMAYFDRSVSAHRVLRCATDCHVLFGDIQRYDNDVWKIRHKVSIDFGTVYDSNFGLVTEHAIDPVGIVVDRCARLNSEATRNQVIFSSSVFAELDAGTQQRFAKYREEKYLKGVGNSEFYRITLSDPPQEAKGA